MEKEFTVTTLKCLIIDDEETAQYALIQLIKTTPWLCVDTCCFSAIEAIDVIAQNKFDIIFLDVQMPGLSGLDLLGLLRPPRPQIIITSAFKDYAFEGFLHEVCHYLLKPIHPFPFMKAVLKARGNIDSAQAVKIYEPASQIIAVPPPVTGGLADAARPDGREMIWIKSSAVQYPVWFKDIFSVTGLKDYVKITYLHGMLVSHGNVGVTLAKLPRNQFIRINRSEIVNKHAIRKIDGNMVVLNDGSEFQIPAYKSRDTIIKLLTS